jgi:hypothetical protein
VEILSVAAPDGFQLLFSTVVIGGTCLRLAVDQLACNGPEWCIAQVGISGLKKSKLQNPD